VWWKKDGTFSKAAARTPSLTQLIEKGYVWPAMIEGNVGIPPQKKTPKKKKSQKRVSRMY